MDETYVCYAFSSVYKTISRVKIIRNRQTGLNEGYGFVEFVTEDDAEFALATFPGHLMPGTKHAFVLNWALIKPPVMPEDAEEEEAEEEETRRRKPRRRKPRRRKPRRRRIRRRSRRRIRRRRGGAGGPSRGPSPGPSRTEAQVVDEFAHRARAGE